MSVHNTLYANFLDKYGSKEQKEKYLPKYVDGTHVGCFAISEPGNEATLCTNKLHLIYESLFIQ